MLYEVTSSCLHSASAETQTSDTIKFTSKRQTHDPARIPGVLPFCVQSCACFRTDLSPRLSTHTINLQGTGEASRTVLRRALESVGVEFGPTAPEQALITLMRAAGGDSNSAPYEAVVDRLDEPGGFQQGL